MRQITRTARLLTLFAPMLILGACSADEAEEPAPEPTVTDASGAELIAVPANEPGVKVDLPEATMTPVIEGDAPDKPVSNNPAEAAVDKAPPK